MSGSPAIGPRAPEAFETIETSARRRARRDRPARALVHSWLIHLVSVAYIVLPLVGTLVLSLKATPFWSSQVQAFFIVSQLRMP